LTELPSFRPNSGRSNLTLKTWLPPSSVFSPGVTPDSFAALHRVKSDEIFHFYKGSTVEMIQIDQNGKLTKHLIGNDILNGESPQVLVPKGVWQALRVKKGGDWSLMGTTVAPGFEFEDFEVGNRNELVKQFPEHRDEIIKFSRE